LLFSMAEGTVKSLEGPRGLGWYIVALDDITTQSLDDQGELIAQTRQQLGTALSEEYRDQAIAAMRTALSVTRNEPAIAAVRKQLTGEQ